METLHLPTLPHPVRTVPGGTGVASFGSTYKFFSRLTPTLHPVPVSVEVKDQSQCSQSCLSPVPLGPRQAGEELLRLQALPSVCPSLLKDSLLVRLVSPLCPACAPTWVGLCFKLRPSCCCPVVNFLVPGILQVGFSWRAIYEMLPRPEDICHHVTLHGCAWSKESAVGLEAWKELGPRA